MQFHHIGLIVDDIDTGKAFLESLISNLAWSEKYEDFGIGVTVLFGTGTDGLRYELIAPLGLESPVFKHLTKRENMLHHIAYVVDDFEVTFRDFRSLKLMPLGEVMPAVAFKGKRVAFFLTPIRTIIEIIEN